MQSAPARRRLAAALIFAAAAAAAGLPSPGQAFGEPARQVLIEATLVVAGRHDGIIADLGPFLRNQRIDPATEAALATDVAQAATDGAAALAALQADPLLGTQEGAAALVLLSIAGAENQRLADLLAEDGEPKAGKLAARARSARDLEFAAVNALQGRSSRFPLDGALERSVETFYGEVFDLFPFLAQHGLPTGVDPLFEPFSGGPKGKLVERAAFVPGPDVRAKIKKNELEVSSSGRDPVSGSLVFDVALNDDFAVYMTLKLPPNLSNEARARLNGYSAGLQLASDASANPAELVTIEHFTTPDGFAQSVLATKTGTVATFPHPTADPTRELVTFFVKNDTSVTAGALLRDAGGELLVSDDVPTLADLPVLSLFFRNSQKVKLLADDLVIYVTPVLISEATPK
ncbi:MAG TPA: hypothetical protein VHQ66_09865 [Myxococcota bacterium]|jgi:hypothetical protein|nr:hypothetical protein [Myxococcota bacterium]